MVYAVSDRRGRGRRARVKFAGGRQGAGVTFNWLRIIAVGLNILVWIAIIAVGRGLLHS